MPKVCYSRHLFSEIEGCSYENHYVWRLEELREPWSFMVEGYFWGPPNNQDTWLLQATFTREAIYKLTNLRRLQGLR